MRKPLRPVTFHLSGRHELVCEHIVHFAVSNPHSRRPLSSLQHINAFAMQHYWGNFDNDIFSP